MDSGLTGPGMKGAKVDDVLLVKACRCGVSDRRWFRKKVEDEVISLMRHMTCGGRLSPRGFLFPMSVGSILFNGREFPMGLCCEIGSVGLAK